MKKYLLNLSLATVAATALIAPAAASAMAAQDALNVIANHQYVAPYDLQKQYGYWTAKAVSADGQRTTVLVNDANSSFTAVRKSDIGTALPSVDQVAQHLRASGYAYVYDLELDDGFWQAKARQGLTSEKVEFVLHPQTLEVLSRVGRSGGVANGQPVLGADQVQIALQQAGYTRVRGIEFDDGVWEAEATNSANQSVELRVDPTTGRVVSEQLDD